MQMKKNMFAKTQFHIMYLIKINLPKKTPPYMHTRTHAAHNTHTTSQTRIRSASFVWLMSSSTTTAATELSDTGSAAAAAGEGKFEYIPRMSRAVRVQDAWHYTTRTPRTQQHIIAFGAFGAHRVCDLSRPRDFLVRVRKCVRGRAFCRARSRDICVSFLVNFCFHTARSSTQRRRPDAACHAFKCLN